MGIAIKSDNCPIWSLHPSYKWRMRLQLRHSTAGKLGAGNLSEVALPAGEVAVTGVAELTVTPVAAVPPNVTAVAPVKLVPVIVTAVPPAVGPAVGEIDVTVGAGM